MDYSKIFEGLLIGAGAGTTSAVLVGIASLLGKHLKRRTQLRNVAGLVTYIMFFVGPDDVEDEDEGEQEYPEHIRKEVANTNRLFMLEQLTSELDLLLRHKAANLNGNDLVQIYDVLLYAQSHLDHVPEHETRRVPPYVPARLYEKFTKIKALDLPSEPPWKSAECQNTSRVVRFRRAVLHRWHLFVHWFIKHYPR